MLLTRLFLKLDALIVLDEEVNRLKLKSRVAFVVWQGSYEMSRDHLSTNQPGFQSHAMEIN